MRFIEQVESWEIVSLLIGLLFLAAYFGQKIDFENMFKKDSPLPVHMTGEILPFAELPDVKIVPIPDSVYTSLQRDTAFKKYLTGNHKYILTFTYPGCPYSRAFDQAFKHLFTEKNFAEYYRKRIINVGRTTMVTCPAHERTCATLWVYQNCFGNLCIFNPRLRQAVVDSSQNAQQIEMLLTKYKEW